MLISSRILIACTNRWVRQAAETAADDLGCEVATASDRADCLEKLRTLRPDLVVLVPPVPWEAEADLLAALPGDGGLPQVPVLVLPRSAGDGAALSVPVLVAARRAARPASLSPLVVRVCQWLKGHPGTSAS